MVTVDFDAQMALFLAPVHIRAFAPACGAHRSPKDN